MPLQRVLDSQRHRDAVRAEVEEILARLDDLDAMTDRERSDAVEEKRQVGESLARLKGLIGQGADHIPASSTFERHGL